MRGLRIGETVVVHTAGEDGKSLRGVIVRDPAELAGALELAAVYALLPGEGGGARAEKLEGGVYVPAAAIAFVQLVTPTVEVAL